MEKNSVELWSRWRRKVWSCGVDGNSVEYVDGEEQCGDVE